MSHIDDAIVRLQTLITSCTDTPITNAPDYPVSDAGVLPISVAHVGGGRAEFSNGTQTTFFVDVFVDVHFPRVLLSDTYSKLDKIIVEFPRRVHGDIQLLGVVETARGVTIEAPTPTKWNAIETQMVRFVVPIKTFETPIA